jgi:hypothetical protein
MHDHPEFLRNVAAHDEQPKEPFVPLANPSFGITYFAGNSLDKSSKLPVDLQHCRRFQWNKSPSALLYS